MDSEKYEVMAKMVADQAQLFGFLDANAFNNFCIYAEFLRRKKADPEKLIKVIEEEVADIWFLSPDRIHRIVLEAKKIYHLE